MSGQNQSRLMRAERNYKRALARHLNEQAKGERDLGVRQTRRMALAVCALQRARFELTDAKREVAREHLLTKCEDCCDNPECCPGHTTKRHN